MLVSQSYQILFMDCSVIILLIVPALLVGMWL